MKKLYPSKLTFFKTFIWIALIVLILVFLAFSSRFAWAYTEGDVSGYIIQDVAVFFVGVAVDVALWFILIAKNFYEVINDGVVHHRLGRETTFNFENVLYIDEEYSIKHKSLLIYNKEGKELFLTLDKEMELLELFKSGCKNLISKEELKEKFPYLKL